MSLFLLSKQPHFTSKLSSLFPQDCQLCTAASGQDLLCEACLQSLPRPDSACPRCAMPLLTKGMCGQCLKSPPHFDSTLAALRYAFPADQLILGLKYEARLPLARVLGQLLHDAVRPHSCVPNLLIPMPLHHTRLTERGFNQALEITKQISSIYGCPIRTGGIVRTRDTARQADLHAERRRANVRGAFECRDDLSGATVAVVDDVMTTGATLNELARVLKRAGAARVENWVVARTWPDDGAGLRKHV